MFSLLWTYNILEYEGHNGYNLSSHVLMTNLMCHLNFLIEPITYMYYKPYSIIVLQGRLTMVCQPKLIFNWNIGIVANTSGIAQ